MTVATAGHRKRKLEGRFFAERAQIKPWLLKRLAPLGIVPVIERSDDSKIVFKCKSRLDPPKHRRHCPLRIRSNYSIRLRLWTLVLVPDREVHHNSHHHSLPLVDTVAAALDDAQDASDAPDAQPTATPTPQATTPPPQATTPSTVTTAPILPTLPPARTLLPPLLPPLHPQPLQQLQPLQQPLHLAHPVVLPSLRFS